MLVSQVLVDSRWPGLWDHSALSGNNNWERSQYAEKFGHQTQGVAPKNTKNSQANWLTLL